MQLADCEAMLVTQSEHGMTLVPRNGEAIHVPAHAGQGARRLRRGRHRRRGAGGDAGGRGRLGDRAADGECGGRGCGRQEGHRHRDAGGTAAKNSAACVRSRPKKRSCAAGGDLDAHLADWRKQGLRVGFTNGCFDILHPGHVKVLTAARGACDRLIVGLNSDASVKRLKGEGRPVQDERARAEVLAALEAVDLVVDLRGGHADRADRADQAERAGEGRRLHPRAGRRPRDRRGRRRRGAAGRGLAGPQHDVAGRSRAGRQGVSAECSGSRRCRWCGGTGATGRCGRRLRIFSPF